MKSQILPLLSSFIICIQGLIALLIGFALCFTKADKIPDLVILALDKGFYIIFGAVLISGLYALTISGTFFIKKIKELRTK